MILISHFRVLIDLKYSQGEEKHLDCLFYKEQFQDFLVSLLWCIYIPVSEWMKTGIYQATDRNLP